MAYTSHGHQIPGTIWEMPTPPVLARCGGPGICGQCSIEAIAAQKKTEHSLALREEKKNDLLVEDLCSGLKEIEEQIQVLRLKSEEMKISVYQMQDPHGRYLFSDLLCAKAQLLSSLVALDR